MPVSEIDDLTDRRATEPEVLLNAVIFTFKTFSPYSESDLQALYNVAVQTYQKERLKEASLLFGTLNLLCPFDPLFLTAQAKCFKRLGAYVDAHDVFKLAWTLDKKLPEPALHAAECLMLANRKKEAVELIDLVLQTPAMCDRGANTDLRDKAEAWIGLLTSADARD